MNLKNTNLPAAMLCALLFFGLSATAFAQTVTEGKSFGDIRIGRSTFKDVEKIYGSEYEGINHKGYSEEMVYKNLGLSFYACAEDPKKELFMVTIKAPARASTKKGIVLGESTLADVTRLYGKGGRLYSDSDQAGIFFYVNADKDSSKAYRSPNYEEDSREWRIFQARTINRIELVEKTGLRQCEKKSSNNLQINE